ncbi:uncharacterized protein BDZ99DRAFT_82321 [Mytilinidion resinicola]|uniref:Uncharacterized protein n=1 Tax=Mytilinidion resinicola TaxID=574789 RepID=A0A6A6YD45_9PEZI|nr:uncharacterized protein BDZ99DRAFT_82321 [Mytilinidion resinicola]KAF2806630.1 hypothetical protein BDZ99DRAFT_82321 [Mytilinidion resinicola]
MQGQDVTHDASGLRFCCAITIVLILLFPCAQLLLHYYLLLCLISYALSCNSPPPFTHPS